MKQLKDPNTMLIAVAMMLIAVSALALFAQTPEYVPDEAELRAFLVGEWMAVSSPEMTGSELQSFTLTKAGQLIPQEGQRVNYTYDPQSRMVSVDGPEAFGTFKCTEQFDCLALVSTDRRVYVQKQNYQQARAAYLQELADNETTMSDLLGKWIPLREPGTLDPVYSGKSLVLTRDLRCTFEGSAESIPFRRVGNNDTYNKDIFLYPPGNRTEGIIFILTTHLGFPVLRGNAAIYVRETDWDDAKAADGTLLSLTGNWVCWTGEEKDIWNAYFDLPLNYTITLDHSQHYTDCNGFTGNITFDPKAMQVAFHGIIHNTFTYTEEYGFPVLKSGQLLFTPEEHREAAHQLYLQQLKAKYDDSADMMIFWQTEAPFGQSLTNRQGLSVTPIRASIGRNGKEYRFQAVMRVSNQSGAAVAFGEILEKACFSLSAPIQQAGEADGARMELSVDTLLIQDAQGTDLSKSKLQPGETREILYVWDQPHTLDERDIPSFTVDDPLYQDYFMRFDFHGTSYYIRLEEDFQK